ncbi:MAG: hypothetical protein IJ816_00275 [Alloprevotella sp.]|nr:hypothetical protein [Alloprevotella sp.]
MESNIIKRNRPAATVLKEFAERKRGKVIKARHELRERFPYLDWPLQKGILLAHIASHLNDRRWAYQQLYNFWDDAFIQPIQQAWEEHKDPECSWCIIKHFSPSYLLAHQDELLIDKSASGTSRNYFHLCLRLIQVPDFEVCDDLLDDYDCLVIHSRRKEHLPANLLMPRFYRLIGMHCLTAGVTDLRNWFKMEKDESPSFKLLPSANSVLRESKSVADADGLRLVEDWELKVLRDMGESEAWDLIESSDYTPFERYRHARELLVHCINQNLPDEYRRRPLPPTDNPDVGRLLSDLNMEVQEKQFWSDSFYEF